MEQFADIYMLFTKHRLTDKLQYCYVRRKKKVDVGGTWENGESESLKEDYESFGGS